MTSPGGRRDRRRERTRRLLVDAGVRLFSERGLHGTRVEDITDAADVGKGAFYNYFTSKEGLAAEVMREAVALLDREYLEAVDSGGPAEARIRQTIVALERFFDEHPPYLLIFHQARGALGLVPGTAGELGGAVAAYLDQVAARIGGVECPRQAAFEAAVVVAGAVAGSRSFRWAITDGSPAGSLADILAPGLSRALG